MQLRHSIITETQLNQTDADKDIHVDGLKFIRLDRKERKGKVQDVCCIMLTPQSHSLKRSGDQRLKGYLDTGQIPNHHRVVFANLQIKTTFAKRYW